MRFTTSIVFAVVLVSSAPATSWAAGVVVTEPITFRVTNPLEPLFQRNVRGTLYLPAADVRCNKTVVLLMHGLSYGAWAWDIPLDPATYSMARTLAEHGYPAIAVDELGYGASDHPNGWNLTAESYGEITAQMVNEIHRGSYASSAAPIAFEKVVLFGHSAGTEMSELAAGLHGGVDGLIAGAYTHFPSVGILSDVLTQETANALLAPYIYFGGTAAARESDMFNLAFADPAVVAQDTALANLTPSGEILTIGNQPSRTAVPLITAPVLLVLAERDALFPPEVLGVSYAQAELALFTGSVDKSLYVVPQSGHTFMLHPNAPATQRVVTDWLAPRFPACVTMPED